jgi:hypothetical protein
VSKDFSEVISFWGVATLASTAYFLLSKPAQANILRWGSWRTICTADQPEEGCFFNKAVWQASGKQKQTSRVCSPFMLPCASLSRSLGEFGFAQFARFRDLRSPKTTVLLPTTVGTRFFVSQRCSGHFGAKIVPICMIKSKFLRH